MYLENAATLATYGTGRKTGITLHMEEGGTFCAPIYEGPLHR